MTEQEVFVCKLQCQCNCLPDGTLLNYSGVEITWSVASDWVILFWNMHCHLLTKSWTIRLDNKYREYLQISTAVTMRCGLAESQ